MQNTIHFQGREFQVEQLESDTTKILCDAYKLTGPRGADYRLFRNANNRSRLAIRKANGQGGTFQGVWFTDANGTLERV